jgi:hypothetical protein
MWDMMGGGGFMTTAVKRVRVDSKGRIALGKFVSDDVTGFEVMPQADGSILLSPTIEIAAREAWLFKNPKALASVKKGLKELANNQTDVDAVDFSKYLDENED